jgi:hypothetical protein
MFYFLVACSQQEPGNDYFEPQLLQALALTGQDRTTIILPKVPYPVSTPARLPLVDKSLSDPPSMVEVSRDLLAIGQDEARSIYVTRLLKVLDLDFADPDLSAPAPVSIGTVLSQLSRKDAAGIVSEPPPAGWSSDEAFVSVLRALLHESAVARQAWVEASGNPEREELSTLRDLLSYCDARKRSKRNPQ